MHAVLPVSAYTKAESRKVKLESIVAALQLLSHSPVQVRLRPGV